jgi:hypothetical protein
VSRPRLPFLVASLCGFSLLVACTSEDPAPSPDQGGQLQAFWANYETVAGAPNRVEVGLQSVDQRFLSYGTVALSFSYLGTEADPLSMPVAGPTATADFLLGAGQSASDQPQPAFTQPVDARGVYEAEDVTFDEAGFWKVDVTAKLADGSTERASTNFPVVDEPSYPAIGDEAPRTENLTTSSKGVPASAIDSQAGSGGVGAIPDPELHRTTIADAIAEHRPAFVLFSTPVYCVSKFCGPVTTAFNELAKRYDDRAAFIHVEVWKKFTQNKKVVNKGAADWIYRADVTEPWLFSIGPDGRIADRWQNVVDMTEVAREAEKLPVER